jgi:glutathione synthase/RimK-type ligase-like ATP-grasp enzyme
LRRAAFLTLSDPTGFVIDDDLAHEPLQRRGWQVETIPWNKTGIDWARYDIAVIRSTWDFQLHPQAFLETLAGIRRAGTRLENSLDIVRWNMQKTYLRDLATRGVLILPTLWRERLRPRELLPLFEELGSDEIVIKPVMSGNAQGAYRLDRSRAHSQAVEIEAYYATKPLMVQPFESQVVSEGEYSLFYFNGTYSHCVLKVPKPGDFRVQEEHGGDIRAVNAEPALLEAAVATIAALTATPLYARADFVRHDANSFRIMELELVEPALYLRMDAGAPARFADAIVARATEPLRGST